MHKGLNFSTSSLKLVIQKSHSGYISKKIKSKISKRYFHTHVYNSIFHKSQEIEETEMSIDRWMD